MLTHIVKWIAVPMVLMASPLTVLAGGYEPGLNALVCITAMSLLLRAALLHQYVSGAGFIAIAVVFSPFCLAVKIFLFLSLACIAACSAVLAGFRTPAVCLAP